MWRREATQASRANTRRTAGCLPPTLQSGLSGLGRLLKQGFSDQRSPTAVLLPEQNLEFCRTSGALLWFWLRSPGPEPAAKLRPAAPNDTAAPCALVSDDHAEGVGACRLPPAQQTGAVDLAEPARYLASA